MASQGAKLLELRAATSLARLWNYRHDLQLTEAHMSGIGPTPVGSMAMKDICELQPGAVHDRRLHLGARKPGNGRPPVGVERMLRIYFLQH